MLESEKEGERLKKREGGWGCCDSIPAQVPLGTWQQYLLSARFQVPAPSGARAEVGQLGKQMQY